ncbi:uncharacterized protein LOC124421224, partial [Lucilia cuprina]|uniref:uncharacterized protein LOC124421224 n=1 Tax=Lucilia cuprina TaxID=7375 RepID=UPI001F057B7F
DKQLHSSRGIIISNQTLVLQGIPKSSHGQYFCRATNIQGSVSSNEVYLDVKYPPVCKSDSTIIRAALKQTINITCQVDSNPLDNLNYKWHFNNSLESLIELPLNMGMMMGGGGLAASLHTPLNGMGSNGGLHHLQQQQQQQPQHQQMLLHADASHASAGYYQRSKRKHGQQQQPIQAKVIHGRHGRVALRAVAPLTQQQPTPHFDTWSNMQFEDDFEIDHHQPMYDDNHNTHIPDTHHAGDHDDDDHDDETINGVYNDDLPYTQMVYSNLIYKNHLDSKQRGNKQQIPNYQQHQQLHTQPLHDITHNNQYQLAERKRLTALHKQQQQHHRIVVTTATPPPPPSMAPLNNVYSYHIDSYESFGAISCVASSPMGQSQPCWYHIQPAGKFSSFCFFFCCCNLTVFAIQQQNYLNLLGKYLNLRSGC